MTFYEFLRPLPNGFYIIKFDCIDNGRENLLVLNDGLAAWIEADAPPYIWEGRTFKIENALWKDGFTIVDYHNDSIEFDRELERELR